MSAFAYSGGLFCFFNQTVRVGSRIVLVAVNVVCPTHTLNCRWSRCTEMPTLRSGLTPPTRRSNLAKESSQRGLLSLVDIVCVCVCVCICKVELMMYIIFATLDSMSDECTHQDL